MQLEAQPPTTDIFSPFRVWLQDDISAVRLHVMSNNAAVRFYERAGFEVSATKPDYPPGYTAYRMVKQLGA